MSNASRSLVTSDEHERVGPDYFSYYSREVINLLSQDDDVLPSATQTSELPKSRNREGREKNTIQHNDNSSGSLYNDGIGAGLSDFKKERLRSLLRQGVTALSSEVDEMLDPVLSMCHLRSRLESKRNSPAASNDDAVQVPSKKTKVPMSSSLASDEAGANPQCSRKVNDDFNLLLESDSEQVEEIVKKYSAELSGRLGYMEMQLELLLDAVVLKCRPMTLGEKQQLQKLIQKLPPKNLDRVVELICRSKPVDKQSCDRIYVDLEKEDNPTLWRLYYYVEAVEKAKRLPCNQEA